MGQRYRVLYQNARGDSDMVWLAQMRIDLAGKNIVLKRT
jgi:hypothetical protein